MSRAQGIYTSQLREDILSKASLYSRRGGPHTGMAPSWQERTADNVDCRRYAANEATQFSTLAELDSALQLPGAHPEPDPACAQTT